MRHTGIHELPHARAALTLLTLLAPLCGRSAGAQRDVFDDPRVIDALELREQLAAGKRELPVIVCLVRTPQMESFSAWNVRALADAHRQGVAALESALLAALPAAEFTLVRKLENVPCFAGRITPTGLRALLASPLVESVELDELVGLQTDQGITLMNGDAVRTQFTGSRLSIAICDTGVDYNHVALGGGGFPNAKVIGGRDIGDNDSNPMDNQGHGTQVAGIAAGDSVPNGDYVGGVAHGARIYALKMTTTSDPEHASQSAITGAWDWCVTHQNDDPAHPILVINTSFGGGMNTSPCSGGSYQTSAAAANSAGITLFVASGNNGFCSALASPACAPAVIAVGAVYDANIGSQGPWCDISSSSCVAVANPACGAASSGFVCSDTTTAADRVTCYSNSATFLALLAPSHNASTTTWGGGYTTSFGGTSAASPYAAGAGALIIDAALAAGLTLSPASLRTTMIATGDSITDPKSNIVTPRVNIGRAVGVWVQFNYAGVELGTFPQPFNTLAEGVNAVNAGGIVAVKAGSTSETITITKACEVRGYGGTVVVGL